MRSEATLHLLIRFIYSEKRLEMNRLMDELMNPFRQSVSPGPDPVRSGGGGGRREPAGIGPVHLLRLT